VLAQQAQRGARESGRPLYLVEREVIGFDHAQVAAVLMKNWKLPPSLVTVIEHHLEFDADADYRLEAAIVHMAALIGDSFAQNLQLDEVLVNADSQAWDITGLDTGQCEAIDAVVAGQLNGVVGMLFPKLQLAVG
jgi:HD-like signal output (HDOD) protein